MRFLALDFETAGLKPSEHAPVTLAVVLMQTNDKDASVIESREWLFGDQSKHEKSHMRRDYNIGALKISGTSFEQIENDGMTPADVYSELTQFLQSHNASGLTVVSHNAVFDQGFMDDLLFRLGSWERAWNCHAPARSPFFGSWACTKRMFSNMNPGQPATLDHALSTYGLSRSGDLHGATEDATLCGRLFAAMAAERTMQKEAS